MLAAQAFRLRHNFGVLALPNELGKVFTRLSRTKEEQIPKDFLLVYLRVKQADFPV